ncbi:MAG TPA: response regulator [Gemmatimonadales bacterium]|nr:response regulator [Gemmatimonadales bacterium]
MATLLIVEDSEPIRFGLTEYFSARGYQVDAAAELAEARETLRNHEYDLVITDLRLSDHVEGLDVISEVREHHPLTRVILLTAYGSPAVEAAATHLGVNLFLQKPIRLVDLEQAAASLLAAAS